MEVRRAHVIPVCALANFNGHRDRLEKKVALTQLHHVLKVATFFVLLSGIRCQCKGRAVGAHAVLNSMTRCAVGPLLLER